MFRSASISAAARFMRASSSRPNRLYSRFMNIFAATVSSWKALSSWCIMAMPRRFASMGECISAALPSMNISPSVAGYMPQSIFISVLLPAPFSPINAWTLPLES